MSKNVNLFAVDAHTARHRSVRPISAWSGGQPNILLIITDAQRRDTLGCYGNRVCRTPNIDAIAASGVRFDEWYVPNPICMPARASLFTGLMPSVHGVRSNGINLPETAMTLADLLQANGYRTGTFGKIHLNAWGTTTPGKSREARVDLGEAGSVAAPYAGFESIKAVMGHSEFVYGDYRRWLDSVCADGFDRLQFERALRPPSGALCTWDSALPAEFHHTNWVADQTIDFVGAETARPFFAVCSFPDPHMSFCPPEPYCSLYAPAEVPLPRWSDGELSHMPPHFKAYYEGTGYCAEFFWSGELNMRPAIAHMPEQWRDMIAHYWGQVTFIDDAIGRLMGTLDERGLRQSTVVIFTTDHGALMGDHGMHMHGPFHYDGQIRIPCLWSWPGQIAAGRVVTSLAGTIDIAPTILDLVGATVPMAMQGESLAETLVAGKLIERSSILTENDDEYFGPFMRTLSTPQWKLTRYAGQPYGELFDRVNDPDEFVNRWDDPGYRSVRADLLGELSDAMLKNAGLALPRLSLYA